MDKFIEFIRNISPQRLFVIGGMTLFILIAVVASALLLAGPNYNILYGNLDSEDSAAIVQILEGLGEPYRIGESNNSILVPEEKVLRLRIVLAEQGLPRTGSVGGYEIFDRDQGLGTSNFIQEINHLRALEGELSKTITTISGIRLARVHLVLPKRELFSRDKRSPSASVILTLSNSRKLESKKIQAIRSLLASAVPDLTENNISVVDSSGQLLARGVTSDDDSYFYGGSTPDEIRTNYETRIANDLQSLVESVVGFGNTRVEVSAEMDFSQTIIEEEIFDPDSQVARATAEVEESQQTVNESGGGITVTNNLPQGTQGDGENSSQVTNIKTRNEVTNNYEISTQKINRIMQPGQLQRISVAVLVDGNYAKNETDELVYIPRTPEELLEIERLVKTAIGFDATVRQDSVEIVNLQFATDERNVLGRAENQVLGIDVVDIENLVELIVLSIVALVVFLLVLRPLLLRALSNEIVGRDNVRVRPDGTVVDVKTGEPIGQGPSSAGGPAGFANATAGVQGEGRLSPSSVASLLGGGVQDNDLIGLASIDADLRQTLNKQLNEVVERFPSETSNVIKGWLLET